MIHAGLRRPVPLCLERDSVAEILRWRPWVGWGVFALLALGGAAADLWTKHWAFRRLGMPGTGPPWVLIPGVLRLETSLNEGALFGLGDGLSGLFAGLSVVALAGILWWVAWGRAWQDRWLIVALGLVSAGVLGNLYDRLGLHQLRWHTVVLNPDATVRHYAGDPVYAVRDWIHVHYYDRFDWPIFNLADSMLVCGVLMLLVHAYLMHPAEAKDRRKEEGSGQSAKGPKPSHPSGAAAEEPAPKP